MEHQQLIATITARQPFIDTLRALATDCWVGRESLALDRNEAAVSTANWELRRLARISSREMWNGTGQLIAAPSTDFLDALEVMSSLPDLMTLRTLEGICEGAGKVWAVGLWDVLTITAGMAMPLPDRRIKAWPTTPNPRNMFARNLIDPRCGFAIWDESDWVVDLDFSRQDAIEMLCWAAETDAARVRRQERERRATEARRADVTASDADQDAERARPAPPTKEGKDDDPAAPRHLLPRIASIHPFHGSEMAKPDEQIPHVYAVEPTKEELRETQPQGTFFGEHPKAVGVGQVTDDDPPDDGIPPENLPTREENAAKVVRALKAVGRDRADIAVVPEFTLHAPDAIAELLHAAKDEVPRLIVAGSAHHEVDGVRANTSIIYLDGNELFRVSKKHAFSFSDMSSGYTTTRFLEDISQQPQRFTIFASRSTRLAAMLCSDLNWAKYVAMFMDAGVNVFLCPAWTPQAGAFNGAVEMMASHAQTISLVANTPGHNNAETPPPWAISMSPWRSAHALEHHAPAGAVASVINFNEEPVLNEVSPLEDGRELEEQYIYWLQWQPAESP